MPADGDAGPAADALGRVNIHPYIAPFVQRHDIGDFHRAIPDATVTSHAKVGIAENQLSHGCRTPP